MYKRQLWAKLVLNSAYNALSALSQQPYGPLVQVPGVTQVIADIVACLLYTSRCV